VLSDHRALRAELERLETLAVEVVEQTPEPARIGDLRTDADGLLARLGDHMRWEETYLLPALRDADAWGEERALRLAADHREQRELLGFILERLHDPTRTDAMVVRDVHGLIALLREDMREEEEELLDERVLRDDVVAIDMEAG
jgi:iron-sulfur cluster repair protein YtfE (RIC family)